MLCSVSILDAPLPCFVCPVLIFVRCVVRRTGEKKKSCCSLSVRLAMQNALWPGGWQSRANDRKQRRLEIYTGAEMKFRSSGRCSAMRDYGVCLPRRGKFPTLRSVSKLQTRAVRMMESLMR